MKAQSQAQVRVRCFPGLPLSLTAPQGSGIVTELPRGRTYSPSLLAADPENAPIYQPKGPHLPTTTVMESADDAVPTKIRRRPFYRSKICIIFMVLAIATVVAAAVGGIIERNRVIAGEVGQQRTRVPPAQVSTRVTSSSIVPTSTVNLSTSS